MTTGSPTVEAQLLARFGDDEQGALEVKSSKKRWVFFFADGALVRTRSNLKSEQTDELKDRYPDADADELAHRQAARRMWNACRAKEPAVRWVAGARPKTTDTLRQGAVFIDALSQMEDEATLRARLPDLDSVFPITTGATADLAVDAAVAGLVDAADGVRSGTDVLTFSPMPPRKTLAALWFAHQAGVLELPTTPANADPVDDGELDIMGMINDAVAGDSGPGAPAPAPAVSAASQGDGPDHVSQLPELAERIRAAQNHFEVFELEWTASAEDFRQKYTSLARVLHPDRFAEATAETQDLATEIFDKVRAAWEVLGNDEARQKYIDKVIHGKKTEEELAMEQVQRYWAAETEFKRGVAAFNAGRVSQAHAAFEAAVEAVPDELEFQAYHAYTSFALGHKRDPEGAAAHLQRIKDVIEKNAKQERKLDNAWVLLGRAYVLQDKLDQGRKAFIQALRLNPANADATLHMRRVEAEQAKRKKKKGFFANLFNRD